MLYEVELQSEGIFKSIYRLAPQLGEPIDVHSGWWAECFATGRFRYDGRDYKLRRTGWLFRSYRMNTDGLNVYSTEKYWLEPCRTLIGGHSLTEQICLVPHGIWVREYDLGNWWVCVRSIRIHTENRNSYGYNYVNRTSARISRVYHVDSTSSSSIPWF